MKVMKEELWEAKKAQLCDLAARCSALCRDLGEVGLYDSLERMESVSSTVQAEIALLMTEKNTGKKNPEGWVWLTNTSDYHYFSKGRSLCGKWVIPLKPKFAEREIGRAYNCLKCVDAFKKSGRTR